MKIQKYIYTIVGLCTFAFNSVHAAFIYPSAVTHSKDILTVLIVADQTMTPINWNGDLKDLLKKSKYLDQIESISSEIVSEINRYDLEETMFYSDYVSPDLYKLFINSARCQTLFFAFIGYDIYLKNKTLINNIKFAEYTNRDPKRLAKDKENLSKKY